MFLRDGRDVQVKSPLTSRSKSKSKVIRGTLRVGSRQRGDSGDRSEGKSATVCFEFPKPKLVSNRLMSEPIRPIKGSVEPIDKLALLTNPAILADLDLSDSAVARIDQEIERFNSAVSQIMASRMPRDEVDRGIADSRRGAIENIGKNLTETQTTRLQQLQWQRQGIAAFADKDLVRKLQISSDQLKCIYGEDATSEYKKTKVLKLSPTEQRDFPFWNLAKLRGNLSSEQTEKLLDLLGEPLKSS